MNCPPSFVLDVRCLNGLDHVSDQRPESGLRRQTSGCCVLPDLPRYNRPLPIEPGRELVNLPREWVGGYCVSGTGDWGRARGVSSVMARWYPAGDTFVLRSLLIAVGSLYAPHRVLTLARAFSDLASERRSLHPREPGGARHRQA